MKHTKGRLEFREVDHNTYVNDEGWTLEREEGASPAGNQFGRRWVLRDPDGEYVDHDQYRNDLAEEHDLILRNKRNFRRK